MCLVLLVLPWCARQVWPDLLYIVPLGSCRQQKDLSSAILFSRWDRPRSQPLFTHPVLQVSNHFGGPPLNSLQYINACLVLGSPKLGIVHQMLSHKFP